MKVWSNLYNRNGKKLTVSRKKAKILTVYRKRHYPIETLLKRTRISISGRGPN